MNEHALIAVLSNNETQSVAGGPTGAWRHQSCGGNHWHSQYAGNVSVNRLRGGVSGYLRDKHEMNRGRRMDGDFWTGLTTYAATTVSVSGDTRPNTPSLRLQEDRRYAQIVSLFPKPQFYHHCLISCEGLQRQSQGCSYGVQMCPSGQKRTAEITSSSCCATQ